MTDRSASQVQHPSQAATLEWIVQEVVRRLQMRTSEERVAKTPAAQNTAGGGELVLEDRLVAWQTLRDRLDGVRKVVVPARAVITPRLRDELAQRGIVLVRQGDGTLAATAPLVLVDDTESVDLERWSRELKASAAERFTCRRRLLRWLEERLNLGEAAVWWTDRPASAVCRANQSGVPALAPCDTEQWRDALEEANIRCLVLDTRRWTRQPWRAWVNLLTDHVCRRARSSDEEHKPTRKEPL